METILFLIQPLNPKIEGFTVESDYYYIQIHLESHFNKELNPIYKNILDWDNKSNFMSIGDIKFKIINAETNKLVDYSLIDIVPF